MSISRAELLHLAELSNLSFDEGQIESLQRDLGGIIEYISQLDELDTEGVEPTYQVFEMENVWREDEITNFEAGREELLALTAETSDNQIKVPRVL